ncbi:DoxX family protein [Nocardia wallacei]|uniref:DoxX family protein n=1 Tax=Nocardia wallacei TaxID=480035 RepID=UPI002454AEC8|nr:DoxX family protein [Nocardia wallacei]
MKIASMVLAGLLAVEFASFGAGKLLAVASMRKRADHLGFSTAAYRGIGALELAAGGGVLLGLAYPSIGVAAGGGLVLLMAGAIASHLRNNDGPTEIAPAAVSAVVAVTYVVTLAGAFS